MNTTIGCCGNREISRFAALADLYPRSSREGQRARAALALAMVGVKAQALGDLAMLEKVERGFARLGELGVDSSSPAVERATATLRSHRERSDAQGRISDALFARHTAAIRRDLENVLLTIRTGLGLVEAAVAAEAGAERSRATAEGREPNFTASDVGKVLAWFQWFLGGAFPSAVAASDIRLLGTIVPVAVPIIIAALNLAIMQARTANNAGLADALAGVVAYLNMLPPTVAAAVAALPAVPTAPSSLDAARAALEAERTRLAEEAARRAASAQRISWATMTPAQRAAMVARHRADVVLTPTTAKKSSGALLALPAALLAWYLFK